MKTLRLPFGAGRVGFGLGCAVWAACFVLTASQEAWAQTYDLTKTFPVTFYDFHSDRSNPEFEQPHVGGKRTGMVEDELDADEKPVAKLGSATDNLLNRGLRFWFRDWSKLSSYEMSKVSRPADGGHTYLEKFRPIYMYAAKGSTNFTVKPPQIQERFYNGNGYDNYEGEFNRPFTWTKNAYGPGVETIGGYGYSVDSAYTNRVIKGTVEFTHIGGGVYEFATNAFFPLSHPNGVGGQQLLWVNGQPQTPRNEVYTVALDAAPRPFPGVSGEYWNSGDNDSRNTNHKQKNFSYTMEMKIPFQYRRSDNLNFNFRGDDDVWLFIGREGGVKRLVPGVDIGGIHGEENGSVQLNNIQTAFGLVDGQAYDMHLFYCERHADGSNIRITTNILNNRIVEIKFKIDGGDIKAGVPKKVTATVETDTGTLTSYPGTFTWTAEDQGRYNTGSQLNWVSAKTGVALNKSNEINVTAEKAYTYIKLTGCYTEPNAGEKCKDTLMWVVPGDPDKVWIEASADSTGTGSSLRTAAPIGRITIDQTEYVENFYGILRDRFGNWVSRAGTGAGWTGRDMKWPTADPTIATAIVSQSGAARGQGRATRVTEVNGSTKLTTVYTGAGSTLKTDTADIVVGKINYTDIRIIAKQGTNPVLIPKDGVINMTVGSDTTLYAELYDPVNKKWVEMPVTWSVTDVPGAVPPVGEARSWTVTPTGETPTRGGKVTVASGGLATSVTINAVNRDPASMRVFSKRGQPDFTATISNYLLPAGLPSTAQGYVVPPAYVTVTAGATLPLVAKMFTEAVPSAASWLDNLENPPGAANRWVWSFVPGSPTNAAITGAGSALTATTGDSVAFRSTVAHQEYKIRVVYTDGNKQPVQQDITLMVVPDIRDPKVFIEQEWQMTDANKNTPLRVPELAYAAGETEKNVYAVLRDDYGNYIAPSGAIIPAAYGISPTPKPTGWSPEESAKKVVYAVGGQSSIGQGVVKTTGEDGAGVWVVAVDNTYGGKRDSVWARLLKYYYEEIKIVTPCAGSSGAAVQVIPGYCDVPSITISTNDTAALFVVGKCSDGSCDGTSNGWEQVPADWDRDGGLINALTNPPSDSRSWTLRPNATGTGNVVVTRPGPEGSTLTADIPVTITVGAPNRAELVIITKPEDRIAGRPIQFEVKYFSGDRELRDWNSAWVNNGASFADALQGLGVAIDFLPKIVSDQGGNQTLLYVGFDGNGNPINAKLTHKLAEGKDIVTITLYNATDNPHQIKYEETVAGNKLTTLSERFTLLPGEPAFIKIEGGEQECDKLTGKCKLIVDQSNPDLVLRAVAYDEYGNKVGDYTSDWNSDKPIPVDVGGRPVIVYSPNKATENGCGELTVVGSDNPKLTDILEICVTGVTEHPLSAITKDDDGCGYLDKIVMKFKKPIYFKSGATTKVVANPGSDKITVKNVRPEFSWSIDSVTVRPADSTVTIWLKDVAPHTGALQTGWTPTINIYAGFFEEAGAQSVPTTDGAAPVIATAKLYFPREATGKVSENYIEVKFSESVRSSNGAAFGNSKGSQNLEFLPNMLFNIWEPGSSKARMARTRALSKTAGDPNAEKQFALSAARLEGISKTIFIDESTLQFYLENDKMITPPNDYINIRTFDQRDNPIDPTRIRDVPANVPLANNRKVPVTYGNEPGGNMKAIPNPASPSDKYAPKGTVSANHDPDNRAIDGIRRGEWGGTVFEVPLYVPKTGKVRCQLKVYDLAGNLVNSSESNDAAGKLELGEFTTMHLYWNGYNSKAMKVAPGTYKMVVYISYPGVSQNDQADRLNAKNKKFQGTVGMAK